MTENKENTALVKHQGSEMALRPENFDELERWAERFAGSSLIARALQKRPSDVMVVMQKGLELDIPPIAALENIHPIQTKGGVKLVMSADMMVALCLRSPQCEYFDLIDADNDQATFETKRAGRPPRKWTYTMERAGQAGLSKRDTYRMFSVNMLMARCKAELARIVYPDIVGGIHTPDEMETVPGVRDYRPQVIQGGASKPQQAEVVEAVVVEAEAAVVPAQAETPATDSPSEPEEGDWDIEGLMGGAS